MFSTIFYIYTISYTIDSLRKWVTKSWYIQTIEIYTVIKNEVDLYVLTWKYFPDSK